MPKPAPKKRSPMKPISEVMRAWAQALRVEVESWPKVSVKNAFGMGLIYWNDVVFAALPVTRALHQKDAILLKFAKENPALTRRIEAEARFGAGTMQSGSGKGEGRKWRIFLLRSDADVHLAIEWLAEAYQAARRARNTAD